MVHESLARRRTLRTVLGAAARAIAVLLALAGGACVGETRLSLVLWGARVYPSPADDPIADGVVLVGDGRIAAVGHRELLGRTAGARVIDCTGQVLVAGFWNSHVHFTERRWERTASAPAADVSAELRQMLVRHGFTSVVDTGSPWLTTNALRRRIEANDVAGPRILTAGAILFPKGGAPRAERLLGIDGLPLDMPEVGTADEAAAAARRQLAQGADALKVYVATWWNDPPVRLDAATVRAAAAEARTRGKPLLAHPSDIKGVETAIAGGVNVILHTTPAAGPWPDDLLARLRAHDVALVPTLKLWRAELVREGVPAADALAIQRAAVEQLRGFLHAGGDVLFGTDVGYMRDDDTEEELELMAAAGMDYRQILASLTTAPARRFTGHETAGRIAPGQPADLVLLDADPAGEITAFARVARVFRGGRQIYAREGR